MKDHSRRCGEATMNQINTSQRVHVLVKGEDDEKASQHTCYASKDRLQRKTEQGDGMKRNRKCCLLTGSKAWWEGGGI